MVDVIQPTTEVIVEILNNVFQGLRSEWEERIMEKDGINNFVRILW